MRVVVKEILDPVTDLVWHTDEHTFITGSIARSASRQYLIYSEADFEVFRPAGATGCVACYVIGSSCVLVYMLCDMTLSEAVSQQRGRQRPRDWTPVSCRGHSCVPVGQ